ncbi:glycoside hydrolase family 47 protein [Pseudomassariella vexata]|uniref:alpha-1,2-Mannosidase n=1 Tax=Pseudomassariella vexata TaxID=1141098 RepID=A0A1Y2DQ79_9PEZI|nr:glycoside hydrolase family 47 protein [Pseudomassariella vexata]ORY61367.1 glycoside hydrolase family 47 protein [Pseudomassariella vexata]
MASFTSLLVGGLAVLGCISPANAGPAQARPRAPSYQAYPERAAAVMEAFDRAWDGYYQYAFPNDSLKPISKSFENDRNGWGASAIDALSTALIMGDKKVIDQIVDYIPTINFNKTNDDSVPVSLFETTIRYLGGLLSAHDLLSGPLNNYVGSEEKLAAILDQAEHLAENLKVAFNTKSGIPINDVLFGPPRVTDEKTNGLATIGTLILEWTRLSDKTGNKEYAELAQRAESQLLLPQPRALAEPYPGLLGTNVDVETGEFVDSVGGWNGGTDSFYEYLIKIYIYDTSRFTKHKNRWVDAIDSSIKYLASHPTSRPDLTFLAAYQGNNNLTFRSGHLACFDGGNFILGGLVLDRQDYVNFGLALVDSCHETYATTATGIGPEGFAWQDNKVGFNATNNPGPPAEQSDFYADAGYWITSSYYILRPEVIESIYYAYRATGDSKYQDWAWEAFKAINETCSVGAGFSEIENVNVKGGGNFTDFQDSFWFAEVLKYSYLIQAEEAPWQISADHDNEWVFNTEAHPMKVVGKHI